MISMISMIVIIISLLLLILITLIPKTGCIMAKIILHIVPTMTFCNQENSYHYLLFYFIIMVAIECVDMHVCLVVLKVITPLCSPT